MSTIRWSRKDNFSMAKSKFPRKIIALQEVRNRRWREISILKIKFMLSKRKSHKRTRTVSTNFSNAWQLGVHVPVPDAATGFRIEYAMQGECSPSLQTSGLRALIWSGQTSPQCDVLKLVQTYYFCFVVNKKL